MPGRPKTPRKLPTEASLHAAALAHLGRYAATEQSLQRMLNRRIDRWAQESDLEADAKSAASAKARAEAACVVARLAASGAVSDQAFAEGRARSLARAGKSRRAIAAHLSGRGVGQGLIPPFKPGHDLAAAVIHARKRRLGPYARATPTPEQQRRALGSFARAGFDQSTAWRVLRLDPQEADDLIAAFRAAA